MSAGNCVTGQLQQSSSGEAAATASPKRGRPAKVANLPLALRSLVNQALVDGRSCAEIAAELAKRGCNEIAREHIQTWSLGGHKDWLRDQARTERLRVRAESAFALVDQFKEREKDAFSSCNEILLLSQINDVLQEYDTDRLKELLDSKPEQFFKLALTVNAHTAERMRREKLAFEFQKYRDHVASQKEKIVQAVGQNQGLSPETLAKIEEAARLL